MIYMYLTTALEQQEAISNNSFLDEDYVTKFMFAIL